LGKFLELGDGIPVLIDVLRASSTIITALANGIEQIIPVNSEKEAFEFRKKNYILIGEKNGIKIDGFDLGNSPTELIEYIENSNVKNKIVIKTTNATRILCSFSEAFVVSTLNLDAAKEKLHNKKISVVMAGGKYGLKEDMTVGLALYGSIYGNVIINDDCVRENILNSDARKHLIDIGYGEDVEFITNNMNIYEIVPRLRNGIIRKI